MRPRLLFVVLAASCGVLGGVGGAAGGEVEPTPGYAAAAEALAALSVSPATLARAREAVDALLARGGDAATRERAGRAHAVLLALGEAGFLAAGERLAAGAPDALAEARLLPIVAAAENPAADAFLRVAAAAPDPAPRLIAADGLAWNRTAAALPALVALARDPVPGVRVAALRGLFAIDDDGAVEARHALPLDPRPDLAARRLAWHTTRGHAAPDLLPLAEDAYEHGRSPDERVEGARLLTEAAVRAPLPLARRIVEEFGSDAAGAVLGRVRSGAPEGPYEPVRARRIAIRANWAAVFRGDDDQKRDAIDRAVGWIANPVRVDAFDERPAPEMVLRMVLPDVGEALVAPTVRRLLAGRFADPQEGVFLLTEALSPDAAARHLGTILKAGPAVPTAFRVAAAEGLANVGRVGDEEIADLSTDPAESPVVRRALVRALAGEPAPWALDHLEALLHRKDLDLDETAVQSLEKRDGEKARRILEAYLFGDATYRDQRMLHLVEPGDDLAYEVLEHALADSRIGLRKAALQILGHVKTLRNARTRAITLAYTRRFAKGATDPEEWQELLYAWIAQVPDETIRLVREHWDAYEKRGWGSNALKTLQNLRAPDQDAGVVDFVLEKATSDGRHPDGEPLRLMYAATALDGRHGYRDDDLDTFWRALLHHPDGRVVMAAVRSLDHRGRGDLTDSLLPLLAKLDVADPSDVAEASDLVDVLARQPQANVEPALLGLVQDENADPVLRRDAGRALVGRVSEAGRRTLVDWLLAERTNPARAGVERAVARAVGSGGGASVAGRILDVLEARLRALFSEEGRLDPDAELEPQIGEQLGALARAVAFTGDATSLERLARLLFLPDLATFARRGVARQACRIGPADASAAARDGPTVLERWHRAGGPYAGLPAEIWHLVDGVKVVPDRDLATAFHAALGDGSAVLAFPDLYFDRIVALLHDRRTGDLHEAASVLEAFAWRAEPVGGAADFGMALDRMRRFAWARRFDEAVAEQERALGILSRRAYDDDSAWSWRNERGTLEALRGAAAAAAGRQEAARTYFANARAIHPYSSQVLRDAAWLRALTGLDLDAAMQDAERAVTLERRQSVRSAASVQTGDVLAFVHLTRGEAYEAADILQEVVHYAERHAHLGGRSHLHLAEALMLAGYPADAWKALRTALDLEPTLAEEVPGIDAFAPWKEKGLLDPLLADARERFFERIERD